MLAPFNGVVTGKYFENGEVYTGAAFGGASKPSIIAIEKINPLKAYVNLSEQYFLSVKKGTKVELKSNLYPEDCRCTLTIRQGKCEKALFPKDGQNL